MLHKSYLWISRRRTPDTAVDNGRVNGNPNGLFTSHPGKYFDKFVGKVFIFFVLSENNISAMDRFIVHSAHSGKIARNGSRRPRKAPNLAYLASYVSCLSSQVPSNMFRQSALVSMNVVRHDSLQSFCACNRDTHDSSTTPAHSLCLRRKMRSTSAQHMASHVAGTPSHTFDHKSVHEGSSTQSGNNFLNGRKRRTLSRRAGASARMSSKVELKRCRARAQSCAEAPTAKRNHSKGRRANIAKLENKKNDCYKDMSDLKLLLQENIVPNGHSNPVRADQTRQT